MLQTIMLLKRKYIWTEYTKNVSGRHVVKSSSESVWNGELTKERVGGVVAQVHVTIIWTALQ